MRCQIARQLYAWAMNIEGNEIKAEGAGLPARINKFLAQHGVSSRRDADKLVELGKVLINGTRASLGDKVAAGDTVTVLAKSASGPRAYFAYNKPAGTALETKQAGRLFPADSLDKDAEGLVILTNDGRVTRALTSEPPALQAFEIRTQEEANDAFVERVLRELRTAGRECEGSSTGSRSFDLRGPATVRDIKEACGRLRHTVTGVRRVSIGAARLGRMPSNSKKAIDGDALVAFLGSIGVE